MKVIHRNTELPIELLKPHPDNPRKDVGDVTELADSIRANGIFQNLTVLKGDCLDGYTVLVGHRRLAAAKLAGLELVPCMVVEMDEREQISTMLLENMQRSDLTVYEQAQGFQMMLDLGETQEGIAEKTGFSRTTIRHRLKLLELDPEEFRKSQERQPTLADYIELEKISDPELRNKALMKIGTSDFKWTVDSAVSEERRRESRAQWLEYLPTIATKIDSSVKSEYRLLQIFYMGEKPTDSDKRKASEFLEKNELYYSIESNNYVYIYCKRPTEADEPSEAETAAAEQRRKRAERERRIVELEQQAAESRTEFVKEFSDRRHISYLTAEFLKDPDIDDIDYGEAADLLDIEYEEREDDWSTAEAVIRSEDYIECAEYTPHQLMLAMLSTIYEGRRASLHDFSMRYVFNPELERWYEILKSVGYKMSGDEKRLLSGEHECFGEADS